jgi:Domain of unknown function (DUF4349)
MKARLLSLLLVLTLGGLLVGCSASSDSASSASAAGGAKQAAPAAAAAAAADQNVIRSAAEPLTGAKEPAGAHQPAAAPAVTRLVRTAQVTIEVPALPAAADKVRAIATTLGGIVSAETTAYPAGTDHGDGSGVAEGSSRPQSVITLRVPEPQMDTALSQVGAVGHELTRTTSSTDVTGTLADLNSRVSSQTRSVERVRDLMSQAKSLKDIVLLESELSQRQSDLEAVEAKQRVLSDQADLSTLTVTLRTPEAVAAAKGPKDAGFLPGLRGGWHALAATTSVVLTVLGALLPIGLTLLLIAVFGYFTYRLLRRRLRPTPAPLP